MVSETLYVVFRFGFVILLWLFLLFALSGLRENLTERSGKENSRPGLKTAKNAQFLASAKRKKPVAAETTGTTPNHAPNPTTSLWLVITDGQQKGSRRPLSNDPLVVGRSRQCDLVLTDTFASGEHARFYQLAGQWYVEDLGSTNGTFIAGQPITTSVPLTIGVQVRIGQTILELSK